MIGSLNIFLKCTVMTNEYVLDWQGKSITFSLTKLRAHQAELHPFIFIRISNIYAVICYIIQSFPVNFPPGGTQQLKLLSVSLVRYYHNNATTDLTQIYLLYHKQKTVDVNAEPVNICAEVFHISCKCCASA